MELGLSLGEASAGSPVPPQTRAFFQLESGRDWRLGICMGVGLHSPAGKGGDARHGEEEATRMIISWKDEILKEEEETEERRSSPADPALQLDLLPLSPTSVPMRHRDDDHPRLLERASSRASDEEESGGLGRKKLRLSKEQSAYLEESFKEHNTLTPKQKLALAKQLNLRTRQVEVWFQNRRARTKLKQTEVDCEHLRRWCERLTEENRRLQKELQELRVLKASDPSYLHVPPTTLTMCPSCERLASATAAAHQHHQQQYHYQSSSDRLQLQLQLRSTQHHFCSPISTESRKRQQPSAAS